MPKYVRQLCFVLIGVPALLALALSASGRHGVLPFVAVIGSWISVRIAQNFRVAAPDFRSTLHQTFIDENLRMALLSAAASASVVTAVKAFAVPAGISQAVNLCVLGWWLAFAGWNLILANLVALPDNGSRP